MDRVKAHNSQTRKYRHTSWMRKLAIFLTMGFPDQKYLGAFYIPLLFQLVPQKYRRNLALNLIAISPHYFGQHRKSIQNISRRNFLETEHKRMVNDRQSMVERAVKPYINQEMTVLDHGCGPGYLAQAAAQYCRRVIAVDISAGVIACAKEINSQPNITYLTENKSDRLSQVGDSSIDFIYSFAVMLHVTDDVCEQLLKEFFRVLKPQGRVICEFRLESPENKNLAIEGSGKKKSLFQRVLDKYTLRVVNRPLEKIERFMQNSGFEIVSFSENPGYSNGYYTFVLKSTQFAKVSDITVSV
jgi:ubiquinone/menaquinone biosynthesis C-methylase UbiE